MTNNEKLYIGIWDNTDENGQESDKGGIIRGKDKILRSPKPEDLLFKMKVLNDAKDVDYKSINAYSPAIRKFDIYPKSDEEEELAKELKRYIFIFKIRRADYDSNNIYVDAVKKDIRYQNISDEYLVIPIVNSNDQIPDAQIFKKYLQEEKEIIYPSAPELGSADNDNGFVIFRDLKSHDNFLFENAELKEVGKNYLKYGLYDSDDNFITARKIDEAQWYDQKYFDDDKEQTLVFVPEQELKDPDLDKYASKYEPLNKDNLLNSLDQKSNRNYNQETDKKIMHNFFEVVTSKQFNLNFSKEDLINFHTSVKTNLLTILTGISGTGKSKIVSAYAQALGIRKSNQFKVIPVRPFWQDDSDLLGYVDTMSNNYHPADSGLVDLLIEAENNQNSLYIILLDEMNLAKIEHYFSQFLSILELDVDKRNLVLYNPSLEQRLYNSYKYKSQIKIGNNIRFVGTMNIDESTFQMSNKLLDRANIITLDIQNFAIQNSKPKEINLDDFADNKFTAENYNGSINENKFDQEQLNFFWELHKLINDSLPDVGIGWRTLRSIEKFISNVPESDINFDSMDYQVAQRIFPRIRGTEEMLKNLLRLNPEKDNILDGSIVKLLDKYDKLSTFKKSRTVLNQKAKELKTYGFAR